MPPHGTKVALVHDWLTNMGGAERVLLALHGLYPEAPVFTSVYNASSMPPVFKTMDIRTSWLQKFPLAKKKHQLFPMLRARAFESFDFNGYELVISDSSSDAKGIRTDRSRTLHINYCHTPTRYYWSHYGDYKKHPGFGSLDAIIRPMIPLLARPMRRWDYNAAQKVDVFIANSTAVQQRIKKYYGRDSAVLFPPVEFDRFELGTGIRKGLLIAGRQIAYKRFDLAVQAAHKLEMPLTVVGKGPEHDNLRKMAGAGVTFVTADDTQIVSYYQKAEYLLFPGEEDAGIVPLEAMACGTPVIAYGAGGVVDSVIDGKTGLFFKEQSAKSLADAVKKARQTDWKHTDIRKHAGQFSVPVFQKKFHAIVARELESFVRTRTTK